MESTAILTSGAGGLGVVGHHPQAGMVRTTNPAKLQLGKSRRPRGIRDGGGWEEGAPLSILSPKNLETANQCSTTPRQLSRPRTKKTGTVENRLEESKGAKDPSRGGRIRKRVPRFSFFLTPSYFTFQHTHLTKHSVLYQSSSWSHQELLGPPTLFRLLFRPRTI